MKKYVFALMLFILNMTTINASNLFEIVPTECIDGDTIRAIVDGKEEKIRFISIDTPETTENEPYAYDAKDFTCNAVMSADLVEAERDPNSDVRDDYNRLILWIYVDGELLQAQLVRNGLAEVKYVYGDYLYVDELRELEKEAVREGLNIHGGNQLPVSTDLTPYYAIGIVLLLIGVVFFFVKNFFNRI